jgi:hypothetical protein
MRFVTRKREMRNSYNKSDHNTKSKGQTSEYKEKDITMIWKLILSEQRMRKWTGSNSS